MAGTVGEGREGVLQLGRKQSSFVELVHAFRGLFCNYFASNPSGIRPFPSQCCSPRHLFAPNCAAVSWRGLPRPSSVLRTWGVTVRSLLKSPTGTSSRFRFFHPHLPHSRLGSSLVLPTTFSAWHALALKCHSSYEASLTHIPISTSWVLFILHPSLVLCLVCNTTNKCELTDKDSKTVDLFVKSHGAEHCVWHIMDVHFFRLREWLNHPVRLIFYRWGKGSPTGLSDLAWAATGFLCRTLFIIPVTGSYKGNLEFCFC